MHRQALRSVCSRARSELVPNVQLSINHVRAFSTTQLLANDDQGAPPRSAPAPRSTPSTARQRSQAAASQIKSITQRGSSNTGKPDGNYFRAGGSDTAAGGAPKVLSVRSLPRGGLSRGRGGLRGRGGFQNQLGRAPSPSGSGSGPAGNSRFGGFSAQVAGRGRGAPRGGGRGRDAARGRRGGANKAGRTEGDEKSAEKREQGRRREVDPFDVLDDTEVKYNDAIRFGTLTQFEPKLDESLLDFVPANTSTPAGRRATVLQNLSALGASEAVGASQGLQVKGYAQRFGNTGMQFFADLQDKARVEQYLQDEAKSVANEGDVANAKSSNSAPIIKDAEAAIQTAIIDQTILGKHETPKFASDTMGIVKSTHLRSQTYRQKDMEVFEKKLSSILGKVKNAAAAKKPAAKPATKSAGKAAGKAAK